MGINDLEQDIIKLSRKYNLQPKEVRKIWNYQFKKIMELMRDKEERYSIRVRGLGTFEYNPFAEAKILQNKKQTEDEREILFESSPEDGDRIELD